MRLQLFLGTAMLLLSLILVPACSRQSPSHIIKGRNIDSLRTRPYPDRLLAFSIELGNRSKDFDERFDVIYNKIQNQTAWQEIVLFEINRREYMTVEKHNLAYLDSLFSLLQSPPSEMKQLYDVQHESFSAFRGNYQILQQSEMEKSIENLIDKKYLNDIIIKTGLFRVANHFDADSLKHK